MAWACRSLAAPARVGPSNATWAKADSVSFRRQLRVAPRLTAAELTDLRASAEAQRQSLPAYVTSLIEAELLRDSLPRAKRPSENGTRSPCGIHIRLTDEQRTRLADRADRHSLSVSSYVEMLLVNGLQINWEFETTPTPLLYIRLRGRPDHGDLREAANRILSDPRVHPGLHILSDHRGLLDTVATPKLVRYMAGRVRQSADALKGARVALVTEKEATFQQMSVFALLLDSTDVEIDIFRDVGEARRWLLAEVQGEVCPNCGQGAGPVAPFFVSPAVGNLPEVLVLTCPSCGHSWSRRTGVE